MWRDICLANRQALLGELDSYRAQLDEIRLALATNDGQRLEEIFGIARQARRQWAGE
jgi:prephenate dehydrogenase